MKNQQAFPMIYFISICFFQMLMNSRKLFLQILHSFSEGGSEDLFHVAPLSVELSSFTFIISTLSQINLFAIRGREVFFWNGGVISL